MHVPKLFGLWAGHGRMAKASFKKEQKLDAWRNVDMPSMPRMTDDVRVSTLQPCMPFLEALLGASNKRMISEAVLHASSGSAQEMSVNVCLSLYVWKVAACIPELSIRLLLYYTVNHYHV